MEFQYFIDIHSHKIKCSQTLLGKFLLSQTAAANPGNLREELVDDLLSKNVLPEENPPEKRELWERARFLKKGVKVRHLKSIPKSEFLICQLLF